VASVRKRSGSKLPWLVSYRDHSGTQRYRQFRLRADADAHALAVERAKQTGGLDLLDAGRETVRDYGAKFFAGRKAELAPATAKTLASVWNAHVHDPALAGMQLRSVRPSDVQALKVGLAAAGVGDGSTRKSLGLLSQVFEAAALDGIVSFNPCAPVRRPSGARTGDVRASAKTKALAVWLDLKGVEVAYIGDNALGADDLTGSGNTRRLSVQAPIHFGFTPQADTQNQYEITNCVTRAFG
jgi:hypothetical protein